MNETVRSIARALLAANASAAMHSAATSAAPGREASIRISNGSATDRPSASAARRLAWSVPRKRQNRPPLPLGSVPFVGSGGASAAARHDDDRTATARRAPAAPARA